MERKKSLLLVDGSLGFSEGPGDEEGHHDGEDGDDHRIDDETGEAVSGIENPGDGSLDSFVPSESGDETERCRDEGGKSLEQLNFKLI